MGNAGEYRQLYVLSDLVSSLTKIVQSMSHVNPVNAVSVPVPVVVSLKENIWKGKFVEVLSLMPAAKDVNFRSGVNLMTGRTRISVGQFSSRFLIGCKGLAFSLV